MHLDPERGTEAAPSRPPDAAGGDAPAAAPGGPAAGLREALERLRGELDRTTFGLTDPARADRDRRLEELRASIRERIVLKLDHADLPLFVVLAGGSGVGKSTILNTVVGRAVAETGVVRPTTTIPSLYLHRAKRDVLLGPAVLPRHEKVVLADTNGAPAGPHPQPLSQGERGEPPAAASRVVVRLHDLGPLVHLALVDAPDFDTVRAENHALAEELIDLADLVIFVTSPAKYGDDRPWRYITVARERGKALAFVFNRTLAEDASSGGIVAQYRDRLSAAGVDVGDETPVIVLREEPGTAARKLLGDEARGAIEGFLSRRVARSRSESALHHQAVAAASRASAREAASLAREVSREAEEIRAMADAAAAALRDRAARAIAEVETEPLVNDGLVRELIQERLPHLAAKIVEGVAWLLEQLSFWKKREERDVRDRMEEVVSANLERKLEVTEKHLREAHHQIERSLQDRPTGEGLARSPEFRALAVDSRALSDAFRAAVGEFRRWLGDQVASLTKNLAWTGRFLYVIDILTAAVMVTIFAHTGGLTGTEVGVAGAASAFESFIVRLGIGEAAYRGLLQKARERYREIFQAQFAAAEARYRAFLDARAAGHGAPGRIEAAARAVEEATAAYERAAEEAAARVPEGRPA